MSLKSIVFKTRKSPMSKAMNCHRIVDLQKKKFLEGVRTKSEVNIWHLKHFVSGDPFKQEGFGGSDPFGGADPFTGGDSYAPPKPTAPAAWRMQPTDDWGDDPHVKRQMEAVDSYRVSMSALWQWKQKRLTVRISPRRAKDAQCPIQPLQLNLSKLKSNIGKNRAHEKYLSKLLFHQVWTNR